MVYNKIPDFLLFYTAGQGIYMWYDFFISKINIVNIKIPYHDYSVSTILRKCIEYYFMDI